MSRHARRQGLSIRAFAEYSGIGMGAITWAKKHGRLVLFPDGSIDPDPSIARIRSLTRPKARSSRHAALLATPAGAAVTSNGHDRSASASAPEPVGATAGEADAPQASIQLERLPDAIASTLDQIRRAAGHLDYEAAQTLVALLRAYTAQLQAARARGELVERQAVERLVTAQARAERDAWLSWPSRVAALIAADLGADAGRVQAALERHVRQHLTELGSAELDLSQLAQGRR